MKPYVFKTRLLRLWQKELSGYRWSTFQRDLLAGVTVAAVALPLALAFGVASGATAAAGLVTAVVAGIVISILSGAPFQISGPTGAMSAVLIVVATRYGLPGVWIVSLLAGLLITVMGIFRLGQIVNFIPSAVIAGFTSGISVIIFVGQIGNLLGVETITGGNTAVQLWHYIGMDRLPNFGALLISFLVIATMILWPRRLNARFPGSLLALIVATVVTMIFKWDIPTIGAIPQTIILEDRLTWDVIPWHHLASLVGPALSVALLGAIESLLCGAVIGRQTDTTMDSVQELYAQGIGNMIVPFFGGVPATAAIARASVAVRSGAATRMTGIIHGIVLLLAAMTLAPVIAQIPVSALAGVLAVTAWRMNDWAAIRAIFQIRFYSELPVFAITLLATAILDLTQAILIGFHLAALIFILQSSRSEIIHRPVSEDDMRKIGHELHSDPSDIHVIYVVGPLFFGTVHRFRTTISQLNVSRHLILSLRTVPLIDITGITAISELIDEVEAQGRKLYLSGLATPVRHKLEKAGILQRLGEGRVFWSADQAIVAADRHPVQET